ncbi:nuclear transport factor 2 family protein [Streptomyces sp. NPDC052682]|uniref:nuclear transport factor 2 family protein n=1 Tax=Streptomyces sp. NPDC052682 TaxID=3154954 RepID=UPI003417B72E
MTDRTPAVAAAVEAELALLDGAVRGSPQRVDALLHPDFHEFGASGRVWDRAAIIAMLADTAGSDAPPITASRIRGVQLAADLVHLTYDTDAGGRRAHRSSLWRRTRQGWQLYFHQATPFSGPEECPSGPEECPSGPEE